MLSDRHRLPVQTVLVLLRRSEDMPELTGVLRQQVTGEAPYLEFRYRVIRVWEQPVESLLQGGLGRLPLAPLSDVSREALPGVIRRMADRLTNEADRPTGDMLWTAAYVLMGLRYAPEVAAQLFQGVRGMRESSTYQAILAEGRAEGVRSMLLLQGTDRFGSPDAQTAAAIESITDISRLQELGKRVLHVSSWQELLAPASPRRRNGRRKKSN